MSLQSSILTPFGGLKVSFNFKKDFFREQNWLIDPKSYISSKYVACLASTLTTVHTT